MTIGFKQRYKNLMSGKIQNFNKFELWELIERMHFLNINTLSIQKSVDNNFWCKVDKPTVNAYKLKEKMRNE